jgi:4-amino-4-deoxy-L-arabinose transferase-like glycosyltransferase
VNWRGWLLPLVLVGSAAVEAVILADFPDWSCWMTPLVVGLCLVVAGVLVVVRLVRLHDRRAWTGVVAAAGVLALLFPMTVWAFIPVWHGGHTGLPYAGPDLLEDPQRSISKNEDHLADCLVDYLLANQGDETYLAATLNARTAAPIILATGEPVMALGGFSGGDPILTVDELAEHVADGAVRYFLLPPGGGRQHGLTRWVPERCTLVPPALWQSAPSGPGGPPGYGPGGTPQLFDCGTLVQG